MSEASERVMASMKAHCVPCPDDILNILDELDRMRLERDVLALNFGSKESGVVIVMDGCDVVGVTWAIGQTASMQSPKMPGYASFDSQKCWRVMLDNGEILGSFGSCGEATIKAERHLGRAECEFKCLVDTGEYCHMARDDEFWVAEPQLTTPPPAE